MRSTAIVKVTRELCDCGRQQVGRPAGQHPRFVARCRDCGWEQVEHVRVILDASGTGLVQRHRVTCPAMQGGAS